MGSEKKDGPFVGPSNARLPSLAAVDRLHWTRSPRSQCSPTSSPDPASTAKNVSSDMSLSCVTRGTSRDDCSYSRFLAWTAVQRNASRFMSSSDRLSCPLIRCRKQLPDHESMLKHLASCPQLPTREYWCYDHMRVEHFDDAKCRRCISHPSRRRRMLSMAKGFFSTLGHKSKRGPELEFDVDDTTALAPPSYFESLSFDPPAEPELSSTEILEIDSTEVTVPQAPADAVPIVDPQVLMLPELDSTTIPSQPSIPWQPELWDVSNSCNRFTTAAPTYESVTARQPASQGPSQDTPYGQQGPRPVPAASRSKHLSPSSSVRSTTSTMSNVSNISSVTTASSLWSTPSTAWSGFETNLTTPPTGLISPVDMCQEHDFPDLSKQCPSDPLGMLPELPELEADMPAMPELSSGDFFSFDTDLTKLSYPDNFVLEEENIEPPAVHPIEARGSGHVQSETKSLVASAWDALQEHIVSSADKIQHIQNNPLVDQLKLLSAKTIAQRGFSSLRGILESRPSASPLDTLCLVHVIYSFALVVYGDDATRRSSDFYSQSLLYSTWFAPDNQAFYREVVEAIWQPGDMTFQQSESLKLAQAMQPEWPRSVKGKERATRPSGGMAPSPDPLVTTALHFLDELEISAVLGPSEALASDLLTRHAQDGADDSRSANSVTEIVAGLINAPSILVNQFHNADGLIAELSNVNQNLSGGLILSTRRFELEALQAGQNCIVPVQYFDNYVPLVRSLCDPIYELDTSPEAPKRQHYYNLSMALSEALIVELDAAPLETGEIPELEADDDALFDCIFDSLTPSLTDDFIMDMDIETQPLLSPEQEDVSKPTGVGRPTLKLTPPETNTSASGTESPSSATLPSKNALQTPVSPTSPPQQKIETADACCELCGYRPKGDPRWFHGSMAKHKKTQHSTEPPKIYKCPYPGCISAYKNRPDNLRQHQIEKNHFVDGHDGSSRRPSKRKKMAS